MSAQLAFLSNRVNTSDVTILEQKRAMAQKVVDELLVLKEKGIMKRFVDFIPEVVSKLSADIRDVQDLLWRFLDRGEIHLDSHFCIEVRRYPVVPDIRQAVDVISPW